MTTAYTLRTDKSWHQTMEELAYQFEIWGVTEWKTNYPKGARLQSQHQSEADRTVQLTYTKDGRPVTLTMNRQARAADNLRVLYLAVEAMRLNEKRGVAEVVQSAYVQLAAPQQAMDPYELLGIRPDAPLEVAEAAYKARVRRIHPDAGGSEALMKTLNEAITHIRNTIRTSS